MDHHCIWANNCIGLYNYRYYLGLILYMSIALAAFIYTHLLFKDLMLKDLEKANKIDFYLFTIIRQFDLMIFVFILPSTLWNWNLALSGKTKVEYAKNLFQNSDYEQMNANKRKKQSSN